MPKRHGKEERQVDEQGDARYFRQGDDQPQIRTKRPIGVSTSREAKMAALEELMDPRASTEVYHARARMEKNLVIKWAEGRQCNYGVNTVRQNERIVSWITEWRGCEEYCNESDRSGLATGMDMVCGSDDERKVGYSHSPLVRECVPNLSKPEE